MSIKRSELRVDAREKLNGEAKYIRDEKFENMIYGTTVRSAISNGNIKDIIFLPDFDWDNITVVTAKDVFYNQVAFLEFDMPFLAENVVRYVGEPIVLLASDDKEKLAEAKKHIKIVYEELPCIIDLMLSENSDIKLYKNNNIFKEIKIEKGDLNQAKQEAKHVIKIETETGFQEHLYLEPQGLVAIPEDGRVIIKGSMQCPYYIKNALEKMLGENYQVTVIQSITGGAFGGKEDFPSLLGGHAALLAIKANKPVAMFYDREEDILFTTKRHPSKCFYTAYVDEFGKILGLDTKIYFDGGAYSTLSSVVLSRGALTSAGSYYIPNASVIAKAVATNTVPSGAFRGFGGPQAVFAVEMLIEKIALELNINPLEVRQRNLIQAGLDTITKQLLKYSVSSKETLADVLQMSGYVKKYEDFKKNNKSILEKLKSGIYPKKDNDDKLKGIGLALSVHGAGFTGTGENKIHGKMKCEVLEDGRIEIFTAQTEMGQGLKTTFRKILADALKINMKDVILSEVNTDLVPNSGPTVASRSTMVIGSLLTDVAKDLLDELSEKVKTMKGKVYDYKEGYFSDGEDIISFKEMAKTISGKIILKEYSHPPLIKFDDVNYVGDAYPVFSWAASIAELEIDPITFESKVINFYTSHDIGKAINHDQVVAQIQGGCLQGIGYALYERTEIKNGKFDVSGFNDYIIPTLTESPNFYVNVIENPYPFGPFGAKGLGELPLVGASPAVASAFWMVFGKEFNKIPILPEEILTKLLEKEE